MEHSAEVIERVIALVHIRATWSARDRKISATVLAAHLGCTVSAARRLMEVVGRTGRVRLVMGKDGGFTNAYLTKAVA